jgi:hypothetical protein
MPVVDSSQSRPRYLGIMAVKRAFIAGPTVSDNLPANWQQAVIVGIDGILTDYPLELRITIRKSASK